MFFWSKIPFVRFTISFALGIMASVFLPGYQTPVLIISAISFMFLTVSWGLKKRWFLKINWLFGLFIVVLSFCLGYTRLFFEQKGSKEAQFTIENKISAYKASILTEPIQKGTYFKSTAMISYVKDSSWVPISFRINLYVKSATKPFSYGDEILVKGGPQALKGPRNPYEFDYKRYLTFLTIYQQHFADSSNIKILSSENGNPIMGASIRQRAKFSALLEKYMSEPKEIAIAKALLLGSKDQLDDDTKDMYAASGAMHVLAVSGLHVGIIYLALIYLFKLVPKSYRKAWIIATVAIPVLWSYAFITGLSPSVLRAVTLFSIIAIGNSINRRTSMANILAASALILLLYNPYLLMQVGFQLSYVAVLGIIFMYPQIRKLAMPNSRIGIFFWDVTSISIAAQIATFPLSILYFHRFPPYFIISNLVVIPAATLIVWVGIAFFIFSWINSFAIGLGYFLAYIIRFVNTILDFIYGLPGSDLNSIYLDVPQTWMLYLLISLLLLFVVIGTLLLGGCGGAPFCMGPWEIGLFLLGPLQFFGEQSLNL